MKMFNFEVTDFQGAVSIISIHCYCDTAEEALNTMCIDEKVFAKIKFTGSK